MNRESDKTRLTATTKSATTTSESNSGQADSGGTSTANRTLRSLSASQRSVAAANKASAVLIRILFQYLLRVDGEVLVLAREVLKDCKRKHDNRDSKFATLAEAVNERVRNAVGEAHWAQACQIQSQLVFNQRKKRVKMALKRQGRKSDGDRAYDDNASAERDDAANSLDGDGGSGNDNNANGNHSTKRSSSSLVNADITVPRRQLRRVKKRKTSRSPSSSGSGESGNSDSSYTSTSSLTTSGNEKGSSTSSTAPSTSSTGPSTSENDNSNNNRKSNNHHHHHHHRRGGDQERGRRMDFERESSSSYSSGEGGFRSDQNY